MRTNARFIVVLALAFSAFACGGETMPTAPTPPTPPGPSASALTGTVRETMPAPNPALMGSVITVMDGEQAGKTATADANGAYRIEGITGNVAVRVTKEGYEPQIGRVTVNSIATMDFGLGHVWPDLITTVILSRLPVVDGLRLKRQPGSGPSNYSSVYAVVVYVTPAPVGGEVGAIAHEVCHGHQDKLTRDAGLGPLGGDHNAESGKYYQTAEGKDFIQSTGWRFENGRWIESRERGWGGYPNPVEDSAQTCATFYNPGSVWAPLESSAPRRYAWAQRWLPR